MYDLTLTHEERKALDWIGDRYRHGYELYRLLWVDSTATPDDADWDDERDITFSIPEHVAWTVGEIVDEGLDNFSDELADKLRALRDRIV
jgi:hypothetical protein